MFGNTPPPPGISNPCPPLISADPRVCVTCVRFVQRSRLAQVCSDYCEIFNINSLFSGLHLGIIKSCRIYPMVRKIFQQICEKTEVKLGIWKPLSAIFLACVILWWKQNMSFDSLIRGLSNDAFYVTRK
jgi:hypothetical protein